MLLASTTYEDTLAFSTAVSSSGVDGASPPGYISQERRSYQRNRPSSTAPATLTDRCPLPADPLPGGCTMPAPISRPHFPTMLGGGGWATPLPPCQSTPAPAPTAPAA